MDIDGVMLVLWVVGLEVFVSAFRYRYSRLFMWQIHFADR